MGKVFAVIFTLLLILCGWTFANRQVGTKQQKNIVQTASSADKHTDTQHQSPNHTEVVAERAQ